MFSLSITAKVVEDDEALQFLGGKTCCAYYINFIRALTKPGSDRIGSDRIGSDRTGLTKPRPDVIRLTKPGSDPKKLDRHKFPPK